MEDGGLLGGMAPFSPFISLRVIGYNICHGSRLADWIA